MQQVYDLGAAPWSGAKGSDLVDGHDLAIEAWGDRAKEKSSGLTAFAYLWRRFGPPWQGGDDHKELVSYWLTTADPGVVLTVGLSGSSLPYAIGYLAARSITDEHHKPLAEYHDKLADWIWNQHPELHDLDETEENREKWANVYFREVANVGVLKRAKAEIGPSPKRSRPSEWKDAEGPVHQVNQALFDALKELERPVYVRDIPINIFGRCEGSDDAAERSEYAGYGIPKDAMDKWVKGD